MAYNQEIADYICEQLAMGRSLLSISKDTPDKIDGWIMPSRWEIRNWEDIEPHRANSMRAREIGLHKMAEECVEISDDGRNDWMEREGGPQLNTEHVQRSKLRIETRMRLLGKWLPKVYGDKLELGGEIGMRNLSDDQVKAQTLALMAKIGLDAAAALPIAQDAPGSTD